MWLTPPPTGGLHRVTVPDILDVVQRISRILSSRRGPPSSFYLPSPHDGDDDPEQSYTSIALTNGETDLRRIAGILVRRLEPVGPGGPYYAVDGGHRVLEFTGVTMVVSSIAVGYSDGLVVGGTYPDSGAWPYVGLNKPPLSMGPLDGGVDQFLVATRPLVNMEEFIELVGVSSSELRSRLSGFTYGPMYSRQTMADENRVLLENAALAWSVDQGFRVLVDGPLYSIPGGLVAYFMSRGLSNVLPSLIRAYYLLAYLRLMADRAAIVAGAVEAGKTVAAVVKRLANSRMLSRGLVGTAVPGSGARDIEVVEYLVNLVGGGGPGVYLVGPVLVVLYVDEILRNMGILPGNYSLPLSEYGRKLYRDGVTLGKLLQELRQATRVALGMESSHLVLAKKAYYLYVKGFNGASRILRLEFPLTRREAEELRTAIAYKGSPTCPRLTETVSRRLEASPGEERVAAEAAYMMNYVQPYIAPAPLLLADKLAKSVAGEVAWMCFQILSRVATPTYSTLVSMIDEQRWRS